jgi:hypothetical protein
MGQLLSRRAELYLWRTPPWLHNLPSGVLGIIARDIIDTHHIITLIINE